MNPACLVCGHGRAFHQNADGAADRCHLIGCTCTAFEGGDAHDPRRTPEDERNRAHVTGPVTDHPTAVAGPPDPGVDPELDPDLDADRQVIANATPGPWYTFGLPWFPDDLGVLAGSSDPHVATLIADLSPMDALDDESGKWAQNPADAEFIARARSRWPLLVDQHARLQHDLHQAQAKLAEYEAMIADQGNGSATQHHWKRTASRLMRENHQLRQALERPVAAEQDHHA